ncbi:MAG: hypothetical protein H6772_02430 [Pseudomonadales bacterium]|nr:hypothetical protein [Pseudomonadales bacterium]
MIVPDLIFITGIYFFFLNQKIISQSKNWFDFIIIFFKNILNGKSANFDLIDNAKFLMEEIMSSDFHIRKFQIIFFIFVFILSIIIYIKKNKNYYTNSLMLALATYMIVFISLTDLRNFYFFPAYIILVCFVIINILKLNQKVVILVFLISIFFNFGIIFNDLSYRNRDENKNKYQLTAEIIDKDLATLSKNEPHAFLIYSVDDTLNFSNPVYWLYLEKKLNYQIVENGNFFRFSLLPITKNSNNLYLICDNPNTNFEEPPEKYKCLERIEMQKGIKNYSKLFDQKNNNFSIYKIDLIDSMSRYETL